MGLLRMSDRCQVTCVGHKLPPRRHFPLSLLDNGIVSEIICIIGSPDTRTFVIQMAGPSISKQPHHPHGLNTNEATSHVFMLLANTTKNYGDYYQSDKWHLHIKIHLNSMIYLTVLYLV